MLDHVESIFENRKGLMKQLKKKKYEANMQDFRRAYGHYFEEMTAYTESADDQEAAAKEIGGVFADSVKKAFASPRNGKIKGYLQVDLNFFMIYYVFPALLLTEHKDAKLIADALCRAWNAAFDDTAIQYTDYETILGGFRNKIFGIF